MFWLRLWHSNRNIFDTWHISLFTSYHSFFHTFPVFKYYFVMFDLDKFKRINDELGHVDGDNALRRLSQVTKDIVRKADVFARFGGDEFVLLLPNISEQNALNLVEKVREGINAIVISEVSLSSSFGVTLMQQSDTLETLIQRADRALYASKEKGGNTITLK